MAGQAGISRGENIGSLVRGIGVIYVMGPDRSESFWNDGRGHFNLKDWRGSRFEMAA